MTSETASFALVDRMQKMPPGAMRLFISYEGERVIMDVTAEETVRDVKETVREIFRIGSDEGASGAEVQERKTLSLMYAGSDLDNSWFLTDLGILSGSTIKAVLKDEIKPSMFVYCVFNGDTIPLFEKINPAVMKLDMFRGIVSRKVGLPVSVFRLMSEMESGREMFDSLTLDEYGVALGQTVRLETWDGWNELLNLAINGFASQMMSHVSSDEVIARFQLKTALYVAAHYGHVDLALHLLRQGIRADEALGEHPKRQWCKQSNQHIDTLKAPIHEAAEAGQLGVLRSFVHHNMTNVLAKDGNDLTALNIALRRQQKACASFLLTKQWNKVNYTKKASIPLSIYCKMKQWSEKAKDKVLLVHGQWKSSMKNPRRNPTAALISHGVQLDGFSKSKVTSKTASESKIDEEMEIRQKKPLFDFYEEERANRTSPTPDTYFKTIGNINTLKLPKLNRLGRILSKVAHEQNKKDEEESVRESARESPNTESQMLSPDAKKKLNRPRSRSESRADSRVKLPPITERKTIKRGLSMSHQNLSLGNKDETEFQGSKGKITKSRSLYLRTSGLSKQISTDTNQANEAEDSEYEAFANQSISKKKKDDTITSAVMIAKSRSDGFVSSIGYNNQTKASLSKSRNDDAVRRTLTLYEKYRGQKSRDYALKCLSVANTFKDKAWLQQVNQAMAIAKRGVKKIVDGQPNLFNSPGSPTYSRKSKAGSTFKASMTGSYNSLTTV